jgi:hypothetical protein
MLALGACSTSSDNTDGGSNPTPPAVKNSEIDRMGRPAINTALTNPFDTLGSTTVNQAKDEYNANATRTSWTKYVGSPTAGYFSGNLAIFDSLDTVCGNQLAAAGTVGPTRYNGLAGVLADDELFVDTSKTTCTTYLGVELNALNLIPNTDCGGRTPNEDVIDETYSALAIGAASGVTDGVPSDVNGPSSLTAFPFLTAPN